MGVTRVQQTGPATAPPKRGPGGGERHPEHRPHVELRLVDRVEALERAAAEERPPEAPPRASRWSALVIWLAVATGLAGGLLLAHKIPGKSSTAAAPAGATAAAPAAAGHNHAAPAPAPAAPAAGALARELKKVKVEHYKRPSPLL